MKKTSLALAAFAMTSVVMGSKLLGDHKMKEDGFDLEANSSPTQAPTQFVEWYYAATGAIGTPTWSAVASSFNQKYVLAYSGTLYYSSDYGHSYKYSYESGLPGNYIYSMNYFVMSSNGQNCAALGGGYAMKFSSDFGQSWTTGTGTLPPTSGVTYSGLAASSTLQYIYALVNTGVIYISSNYGQNFAPTSVSSVPANTYKQIACSSNGQYVFMVPGQLSIEVSSDYGVSFNTSSLPSGVQDWSVYWNQLAASASGQYVFGAASAVAGLFVSSDYGVSFALVSTPNPNYFFSVGCDPTGQFVVAAGYQMFNSSSYGAAFELMSSIYNINYRDIVVSNNGTRVIAVSTNLPNPLYYVGPPTGYWEQSNAPMKKKYTGVATNANGQVVVIFGGAGVGLYYSSDYGSTYLQSGEYAADGTAAVEIDSTGQYLVSLLQHSGLVYSYNGGAIWEENGALPPLPSNISWTALAAGSNLQYLYAGNNYSHCLGVSNNYGDSFTMIQVTGTPQYWTDIASSSDGMIVAATSKTGGIFASSTNGTSWMASNASVSIAYTSIASSASGQFMVAASTVGLHVSSNQGRNWVQVTSGTGYVSVASDSTGQYLSAIQVGVPVVQSADFGATWFTGDADVHYQYYWTAIAMDQSGTLMFATTNGYGALTEQSQDITVAPTVYSTPTPAPSRPTRQPTQYPSMYPSVVPTYIAASGAPYYNSSIHYSGIASTPNGNCTVGWATNTLYFSNTYGSSYITSSINSNGNYLNNIFNWKAASISTNCHTIYALSYYYGMFQSTNGGYSFLPASKMFSSGGQSAYTGMVTSTNQQYIYISSGGYVYYSTNYGYSYTTVNPITNGAYPSLMFIACSGNGKYVIVYNYNSYIYYSNNYGVYGSWKQGTGSALQTVTSLTMSTNGQYAYMSVTNQWQVTPYFSGLYQSSNYGVTWARLPSSGVSSTTSSNTGVSYYDVATDYSGQHVYSASSNPAGPVLISNDYGSTWTTALTPRYTNPTYWNGIACDSNTGSIVVASVYNTGLYYNNIPTPTPTEMPTFSPSSEPSVAPSAAPSVEPSQSPSELPSITPSMEPSAEPSVSPSALPSVTPSVEPSVEPSVAPSAVPSVTPSMEPSAPPSEIPSEMPSAVPTTYTPTQAPSEIPSVVPSEMPSQAPSAAPSTERPSVVPTQQPSAWPTPDNNPTHAPTSTPAPTNTGKPSIAPSAVPSVIPSIAPTYQATRTPTTKPTTFVPTATAVPSLKPSPAPTTQPTMVPTLPGVQFSATQVVNGLSITDYNSDLAANQAALQASIADCMDGISSNDIYNLVATSATSTTRSLRNRQLSSTDAITVSYQVVTNTAGLTYDSLANQLNTAVSDGTFTDILQDNAVFYGAGDMTSATSTAVSTENDLASGSGGSSGGLGAGGIAGIVIGLLVVLVVAGGAYWYFNGENSATQKSASSSGSGSSVQGKTESAPPVGAVMELKEVKSSPASSAQQKSPQPQQTTAEEDDDGDVEASETINPITAAGSNKQ